MPVVDKGDELCDYDYLPSKNVKGKDFSLIPSIKISHQFPEEKFKRLEQFVNEAENNNTRPVSPTLSEVEADVQKARKRKHRRMQKDTETQSAQPPPKKKK